MNHQTFKEKVKREFVKEYGMAYQMSEDGSHLVTEVSYITTDRLVSFIDKALDEYRDYILKEVIGEDQGFLEEDIQNDLEDVEKFNRLIDNRNELRSEQRKLITGDTKQEEGER